MNAGFLVVAVVLVLFFGIISIATIGFFPAMSSDAKTSQSRAYWGGSGGYEGSAAPSPSYGGGGYWAYNPLKGADSLWFFIVTIVMPIVTLIRMGERTEKNDLKTMGAGFIGSMLLFGAIFVFIGGFRDMLSLYPSESYTKPTFWQQYGWLVQSIVFGLLSHAALFLAERWRKERGSPRSVYSIVAHNAGLFLALYASITLVAYANQFIDVVKQAMGGSKWTDEIIYDPARLLGWLVYSLVLGGAAFKVLEHSKKLEGKGALAEYTYNTPASFAGIALFASGLFMVLESLNRVVYGRGDYWYTTFLVGAVFVGAGLYFLHWMLRKQEEQGIVRTGHYVPMVAGALLLLVGLFAGVFSLNDAMQRTGYSQDVALDAMLNSIIQLLIGGGLLFVMHEWTKNKYDAKKVQEGSFLNGMFEDTEARKQEPVNYAAMQESAEVRSIDERLSSIDRRLSNIERLLKAK
jgi:hypothetical protein